MIGKDSASASEPRTPGQAAPGQSPSEPQHYRGLQAVRSALEMDEVLRCPALERRSAGAPAEAADVVMGGTLLQLWGEEHRRRRKIYAPLVSSAAIRNIEAWLGPEIDKRLRELPREDGIPRADLVKLARHISLAIGARIIGLDQMDSSERLQRLGDLSDELVSTIKAHLEFKAPPGSSKADAEAQRASFIANQVAKALAARDAFIREYYAAAREHREDLVRRHRAGQLQDADLPRDLIALLILNEEQLRNEASWDAELPIRECTMMLAASDHTTSMSVCHAAADIMAWATAHPDDQRLLQDFAFLRSAVQESLRLHQITDPSPNFRTARERVEMSTGRIIETEEKIALWYGVGGLDRHYYGDDADSFNPHRIETGRLRRPYGFAFSGGAKVCLGQVLAIGSGEAGGFRGDIPIMLHQFFKSGMQVDPNRPAVPKSHVFTNPDDETDRREIAVWESFPVIFPGLQ